jgi:hypothetical protein
MEQTVQMELECEQLGGVNSTQTRDIRTAAQQGDGGGVLDGLRDSDGIDLTREVRERVLLSLRKCKVGDSAVDPLLNGLAAYDLSTGIAAVAFTGITHYSANVKVYYTGIRR